MGIAIENKNKPNPGYQERQLDDYAKHLDSKYKGQYLLLYLTPDGKPPPLRAFHQRAEPD